MPTEFENTKEAELKEETADAANESEEQKIDRVADKIAGKAVKREQEYDKGRTIITGAN